jgi:hypothetical protein
MPNIMQAKKPIQHKKKYLSIFLLTKTPNSLHNKKNHKKKSKNRIFNLRLRFSLPKKHIAKMPLFFVNRAQPHPTSCPTSKEVGHGIEPCGIRLKHTFPTSPNLFPQKTTT